MKQLDIPRNQVDAPDYSMRSLNPDRRGAIDRHCGSSLLDVGCGSGAYVLHYADRISTRGIDHQKFQTWDRRPELFTLGDAAELNVPDASIDSILSFETLEHVPAPEDALREYFRVCRKNVIVTVPNCKLTEGMRASGVIYNHWIDRTHVNFWELDSIADLVRNAGFRVAEARLINEITLGHVFAESVRLSGWLARAFARAHRLLSRHDYYMTCLVVGYKP